MRRCVWWSVMVWWSVVVWQGVAGEVEEKCVALGDTYLPSFHVRLPANITIKPLAREWQLDFTLKDDKKSSPLICLSLETKENKIRLSLFTETCENENIVDFQLWKMKVVKPNRWTTIHVTVNDTLITLRQENSDFTSLVAVNVTLPTHGLLQVKQSRSVESGVGCRTNCPARRVESPNGMLVNAKEFTNQNEYFFFKPRQIFERLNFEVRCRSPLGQVVFVADTDLTRGDIEDLTPVQVWHKVNLELDPYNRIFKVILDYKEVKRVDKGISACDTVRNLVVRVQGEALMSFDCDPSTGEIADLPVLPECESVVQQMWPHLPPWATQVTLSHTCYPGPHLPPWTTPATLDHTYHPGPHLPPWTTPATLDHIYHPGPHLPPWVTPVNLGHIFHRGQHKSP